MSHMHPHIHVPAGTLGVNLDGKQLSLNEGIIRVHST